MLIRDAIAGTIPAKFKSPFLFFKVRGATGRSNWLIEVDGKVGKYLRRHDQKGSWANQTHRATPLLKRLCRELKDQGVFVYHVSTYKGAGEPGYLLRDDGVLRILKPVDQSDLAWMDE